MIRRFLWMVSLSLMLSASAGSAQPLEILIDFGNGAPTPTLGGTWNSTTEGETFLSTVLDSSGGVAPGVTLRTVAWTATDTLADPFLTWTKEWVDAKALGDFAFVRGASLSLVTIGGLTEGELYDVELAVCAEPMAGSWVADYRVNFAEAAVPPSDDSSLSFDPEIDGQVERDILRWRDVPLNSRQELNISVEAMTPDFQAMISAVRIVPEPGASALAGAAAAALLALGSCQRRRGAGEEVTR